MLGRGKEVAADADLHLGIVGIPASVQLLLIPSVGFVSDATLAAVKYLVVNSSSSSSGGGGGGSGSDKDGKGEGNATVPPPVGIGNNPVVLFTGNSSTRPSTFRRTLQGTWRNPEAIAWLADDGIPFFDVGGAGESNWNSFSHFFNHAAVQRAALSPTIQCLSTPELAAFGVLCRSALLDDDEDGRSQAVVVVVNLRPVIVAVSFYVSATGETTSWAVDAWTGQNVSIPANKGLSLAPLESRMMLL